MKNCENIVNLILKTNSTKFPTWIDRQEIDTLMSLTTDLQQQSSGVTATGAAPDQAKENMSKIMLEMIKTMRNIKKGFNLKVNL